MLEQTLTQVIILLGLTVFIILVFKKLQIPASLGYLAVGVLLGAYTPGPVIEEEYIRLIAEFGIVFLLFTIGLSFSMAQIYASRHTILGLGTAQVVLTTAVVAVILWALGVPAIAAFVIGAIFAQSSSTIIIKQLAEQGEGQTRHGRLGTTLSVFQDITAVPFVVVIPVLAIASTQALAMDLSWALLKALFAFFLVFFLGRYLLKPFFHTVAQRNSAELFTLSVLFVSLVAAWTTMSLGLSMAFGAFLAGMMLAETEFKHQVESTIRPFKDVLLGLFFISIGMLFNPFSLPDIWVEVLLVTLAIFVIKILLVTLIVRVSGIDLQTAIRTGLLLAVGGEFGFALLAIGIDASILEDRMAQIVLTSVLFSMILAPFLIRYNQTIASWFKPRKPLLAMTTDPELAPTASEEHVVISGYGRIGQIVGHMLEKEKITYVALDMDAGRVKEARLGGEPVYYGDSSDLTVLEAVGVPKAKLLLICHDDLPATLKTLKLARLLNPEVPILVRTRDEIHVAELRRAGATEVIPETFEAGIMLSSHAMLALKMPLAKVARTLQDSRVDRYQMMRELFRSTVEINDCINLPEFLHSVALTEGSSAIGKRLDELDLEDDQVELNALVRDGERNLSPQPDTVLMPGDVLVLFGTQENLTKVESRLTNLCVIC
ncbi:cation:proton antiporter domain-containing protein [Thiomicrospira cyclica]|uniref:Sodium/hydrogen exchanger n=1 Tax=Thiomicrospira cyclica (strain DSM 14477 / JCM 11371 / ALM1) TaxID=717773 RepID=F6D8K6_THICA|nr:cation:proton antiporter [Thiomicrospira cyclica]AEG31857.1 sodium/hydrogen exchanger [Thiomicrospira cyclica ALM1]